MCVRVLLGPSDPLFASVGGRLQGISSLAVLHLPAALASVSYGFVGL